MPEPHTPDWATATTHRYYIDTDLLYWETIGDFDLEHAKAIKSIVNELYARHGYELMIINAHRAGGISPEARRWLTDWRSSSIRLTCSAIFGMSFGMHTLVKLIMAAIRVQRGREGNVCIVTNEEEAHALVARERARFHREIAHRP